MKHRLPNRITFTGIDRHTSPDRMNRLAAQYPVEYGLLISGSREGQEGRYPTLNEVKSLVDHLEPSVRLAVHVCGKQARTITSRGESEIEILKHPLVRRIQINTAKPELIELLRAATLGAALKKAVIFQARRVFPNQDTPEGTVVQWLFDQSGGRGETPIEWPFFHMMAPKWVGYAGGLNPKNVVEAIGKITRGWPSGLFDHTSRAYWIDMESGVRTDDRFDMEKCEAVCRAVYGGRS